MTAPKGTNRKIHEKYWQVLPSRSAHAPRHPLQAKEKGGEESGVQVNGSGLERSYPLKSPRRSVLLLLPALHESLDSNTESWWAEVAGDLRVPGRVLCGAVRGERPRCREVAAMLRADLC